MSQIKDDEVLHFVLQPHLYLWEDIEGDHEDVTYPSEKKKIDQLVEKVLKNDLTGIKNIMSTGVPLTYHYDQTAHLVHLWIRAEKGKRFTSEVVAEMLDDVSPDEGGPDGWMEGDITIYRHYEGGEDKAQYVMKYDEIELVPVVIQVLSEVNVT